jgi:tetraacyldisaccharide 4'-kinase
MAEMSRENLIIDEGRTQNKDYLLYGDEPCMIHRITKCTLLIGSDRLKLSRMIPPLGLNNPIIVLDDGFQHRRLQRDIDILVLSGGKSVKKRHYLPRRSPGNSFSECLRDDPARIFFKEAHMFIIKGGVIEDIGDFTKNYNYFNYNLIKPKCNKKCFVFSGLARNESFIEDLKKAGYNISGFHFFRDHHRYTQTDADLISKKAKDSGSETILTSMKDMIKLEKLIFDLPIEEVLFKVDILDRHHFEERLSNLLEVKKAH